MLTVEARMEKDLVGVTRLEPEGGWNRNTAFYIKLACQSCTRGYESGYLRLSRSNSFWKLNREFHLQHKCENCSRVGYVKIEDIGRIDVTSTYVVKLKVDGMAIVDNEFVFEDAFVAIDVDGNTSAAFDLEVSGDGCQCSLVFAVETGYAREATCTNLQFVRVRH